MAGQGGHRIGRTGGLLLTGLLLAAGMSACAQTVLAEPVMNSNPLLADPRPWCIGRLVMDRPAQSEVSSEKYEYWGDKIGIASNVSAVAFQRKVQMRENELRTKRRMMSVPLADGMIRNGDNGLKKTDVPWREQVVSPLLSPLQNRRKLPMQMQHLRIRLQQRLITL